MARKVKLTISVAPERLADVKSVVRMGRSKSVSAYIEHAIAAQLAAETDFDTMMAESLKESGGGATPAERTAVRRLLRSVA